MDKKKTAVFTFGRMSPPTNGHEKLIDAVVSTSRKEHGEPGVYVSHTYDKKKNPLKYADKVRFLGKAFGKVIKQSDARTFLQVAKDLSSEGYTDLVMVAGSDRVPEFDTLLKKYNGTDMFQFDTIKVVSAGERDPDADDVSGMSASKMRGFVMKGDFESFKHGLPKKLIPNAKDMYDMTREGMGLHEGLEEDEVLIDESLDEAGVVSLQQRRARGMKMRAMKARLKVARERARRRIAGTDKLKKRAARKARMAMRRRMSGGKNYSGMGAGEKMAVDKRLARIPAAVLQRLAQRQLPVVRRAELARMSNKSSSTAGQNASHGITAKKYATNESVDLQELSKDTLDRAAKSAMKKYKSASKKTDRAIAGSLYHKSAKVRNNRHNDAVGHDLEAHKRARQFDKFRKGAEAKNEGINEAWDAFISENEVHKFSPHDVHPQDSARKEGSVFRLTNRPGKYKTHKIIGNVIHAHKVDEEANVPFAEAVTEARSSVDGTPAKRYHQMFSKDKTVKTDRRFAMFKKSCASCNESDLTELSGKTLRSYAFGAAKSRDDAHAKQTFSKGSFSMTPDAQHTYDKRKKGLERAYRKMSEDGEEIIGDRNGTKVDKREKMFQGKPYRVKDPVRKTLGEAAEELAELVEALGADREWGTDTLTQQLASETPGQADIDLIPNKYAQVAKGDEVTFRIRSVYGTGQAANGQTLSGTVIGADTNRVRVRDENGKLYRVKFIDLV